MTPAQRAAVQAICGPILRLAPMQGGDLSEVWRVDCPGGNRAVAKRTANSVAEAEMLRVIAGAGCPCPRVLGTETGLLVMTELDAGGRPNRPAWAAFGGALRRLHDRIGPAYGWPVDHAFGPVAISNAAAPTWPDFWAGNRLLDGIDTLPPALGHRLETLAGRLDRLLPAAPHAVLLHGDLWSGNVLWGRDGFSGVIDPACYHGHGEVDLAMLSLFGRIGDGFRDGYGAPTPGEAERRPLYQLWPALVHLRLFGDGYRPLVDGLLADLGA